MTQNSKLASLQKSTLSLNLFMILGIGGRIKLFLKNL